MSASCVLSILVIFDPFHLTPYDCPVRRRLLLGFHSKYRVTMYRLIYGVLGPEGNISWKVTENLADGSQLEEVGPRKCPLEE